MKNKGGCCWVLIRDTDDGVLFFFSFCHCLFFNVFLFPPSTIFGDIRKWVYAYDYQRGLIVLSSVSFKKRRIMKPNWRSEPNYFWHQSYSCTVIKDSKMSVLHATKYCPEYFVLVAQYPILSPTNLPLPTSTFLQGVFKGAQVWDFRSLGF